MKILLLTAALMSTSVISSELSVSDIQKELVNPMSDVGMLPIQYNYQGTDIGSLETINLQPVYSFEGTENYGVVGRTIVPLTSLDGDSYDLGNITQSILFTPKISNPSDGVVAGGIIAVAPTSDATDDWSAGVQGIYFRMMTPTVATALNFNYVAGGQEVMTIQPVLAKMFSQGSTISLQSESVYDFDSENWNVPVTLTVSQVLPIAGEIFNFQAAVTYNASSDLTEYSLGGSGVDDFAYRLTVKWIW
ncbi:hypothetical protein [Shewanella youngdeokensis]|uniref:Uncharacterized protein n=1 Tax=Shewanella youngdeokensis TaxID=2999068 RepID=A0ABZ0K1T0_9GAMM|nr:hypothetical protein RGE70_06625 [Shewanella sp. DAU334]